MRIREIGRVGRGSFLLDLQKERVVGSVALEVDAVIAQADGAGSDHLEGHVDGAIEREQMLALRLEHFAIRFERFEHFFRFRTCDSRRGCA